MFLVSLYCMHNRWKNTLHVQFLSGNSTNIGSFSLFFWFMVKFFHLHQPSRMCSFFPIHIFLGFMIFRKTKALIFSGVLPLFCFLSSRTTKNLNFFVFLNLLQLALHFGFIFGSLGNFFFVFLFFATRKLKFFWVFCLYFFSFNVG